MTIATTGGDKNLDARLEVLRRREQELVVELDAAKKTVIELTAALEQSKTKTDQTAVAIKATDLQVCFVACWSISFLSELITIEAFIAKLATR